MEMQGAQQLQPAAAHEAGRVRALIDQCRARGNNAKLVWLNAGKPLAQAEAVGDQVRIGALEGVLKFGGLLPTPARGYRVMAAMLGTAHVHVEYQPITEDGELHISIAAVHINGEPVSCCPGEFFTDRQLRTWEQQARMDFLSLQCLEVEAEAAAEPDASATVILGVVFTSEQRDTLARAA